MASELLLNDPRIALVGNPNCGKTALFNALTGSRQKVANYPGVTVEKREGLLSTKEGNKLRIIDLPGTYSLRARSVDERVTREVVLGQLLGESPVDGIICVADATNLHLGLRLVLELKKTGKPVILALNMMDIAKKRGYEIDLNLLSQQIGAPVVPTVAIKKNGITNLVAAVQQEIDKFSKLNTQNSIASTWVEPNSQDVRAYHKEVERILNESKRKQGCVSAFTQKVDKVLLHPVFGVSILLVTLFLIFQAVFTWAKIPQEALESSFEFLQTYVASVMPDGALKSLLTDGIIAGVGSVVVFLPQIITLFLFILLLEDSGYMARAAFLMDKLMGGVGLHGKAFIPLLSSFACAIPGIMSTRTIENKKDRIVTILISPLMACSARIPVYALIIAAFIPSKTIFGFVNIQGLVMFLLYAGGIVAALIIAFVLKKFIIKGHREPLLMELPTYKIPNFKNILIGLLERAKIFLKKAGTIILAMMVVIWFLSSYPKAPLNAIKPDIDYSFAGILGHWLEPLLAPVGFNWQIAVALIPGMAAREVAVAALGSVYSISGSEDAVREGLAATLVHAWTLPTALALLAWYVFAPQCAPTLAVTKRETNSWLWPTVMFLYMFSLAYLGAFGVYHLSNYFLGA
ncbi:MAG: ferrous iron transport protein B [Bdellovibrionota bacterium]